MMMKITQKFLEWDYYETCWHSNIIAQTMKWRYKIQI
jgi:hypothetical protein